MFTDDKCGIGCGMLCPMDLSPKSIMSNDDKTGIWYGFLGLTSDSNYISFDGTKWTLNETGLAEYLKKVSNAGANGLRILPWGVWESHKYGKRSQFQPYILDESKDKWDLSVFNTYYFPIIKRIAQMTNDVNISLVFPFFDNCQFHGGYKKWSPWVSNVQGITTLYDKDADEYTKRWVSTMTLRHKDLDMIWSFGNEMNNAAFPDFAKRVIFPYIKARKLDFNRLTYGATMKNTGAVDSVQDTIRKAVRDEFGLVAEKDVIQEDHGWPFTATLPLWGNKPYRKLYSDDGFYLGHSLCDWSWKGARPSAAEWGAMAKNILKKYPTAVSGRERLISFEHLPAGFSTGSLECKVAPIRAISAAYRARFGAWPHNYKG